MAKKYIMNILRKEDNCYLKKNEEVKQKLQNEIESIGDKYNF